MRTDRSTFANRGCEIHADSYHSALLGLITGWREDTNIFCFDCVLYSSLDCRKLFKHENVPGNFQAPLCMCVCMYKM